MLLAIDTGNTHTVLGILEGNKIVNSYRIPTDKIETDCGYAAKIGQIFEIFKVKPEDFEGAIISSVVPRVTRQLRSAIKILLGKELLVVGESAPTGLDVSAIPGGIIAPDLEVAAVAAKEQYPLPCIVIDMGTATTVTVLDKEGAYIGGAILPGAGISLNALVNGTSLLPGIEITAPNKAIAVETTPSMQSGLVYGSAGAIDGIIDRFVEEMDVPPASIVATGGLGKLVCKYCRHDIIINDDLLLEGLGIIWEMNH